MDNSLKEQLIRSMFRFKKVGMAFRPRIDISMGEIALMKGLDDRSSNPGKKNFVSSVQKSLNITKPAISQMYNTLEKKGYITREIDTNDRRKIIVTLTPEGQEILKGMMGAADSLLNEVITRLGEEDTKQLIELFNRFVDVTESLRNERCENDNKKGENEL